MLSVFYCVLKGRTGRGRDIRCQLFNAPAKKVIDKRGTGESVICVQPPVVYLIRGWWRVSSAPVVKVELYIGIEGIPLG